MEKHSILIVVCDGMADRAARTRGFQTPLNVAKKPNMDALAETGSIGLMHPIGPGVNPGSDVAHFALLGYNPYEYYTGRGGLEAVGAGLAVNPSDVAFRCNFATVDDKMIVKDRRAGRAPEGREELAKAINEMKMSAPNVSFEFAPTVEHRGVLILRGKSLSRRVSDTDPHIEGRTVQKAKPEDRSEESRRTAEILNEFTEKSYLVLKNHPTNAKRVGMGLPPANAVLSRGAGTIPPIETLTTKYSISAAFIGVAPIVRGICRLAGMDLIDVEGATGGLDTNFVAKAKAAVRAMEKYDLVFLHIKAPDIASHNGDFEKKVWTIEKIDGALREALKSLDLNTHYIVLTSDHATPVVVKDHSADPVPIMIAGPDFDASGATSFSERTAATGNLGALLALNLVPILMNRLGKIEKFGS